MPTNSNNKFSFEIIKKSTECKLARVAIIHTPHGDIKTPAFIPVGTKATVKALDTDTIKSIGGQAVLANTYHLYLQPGKDIVKQHGGFANMMCWKDGKNILPTFTDSGGFQVFSLGAAFDTGVSKIAVSKELSKKQQESIDENGNKKIKSSSNQMAKIDDQGVTFKSIIDGSSHRFTPEISMQIQHSLGADIFFAFDECTSPLADYQYQLSAVERTHKWAYRCLSEHKSLGVSDATGEMQALFAVVQGGAYEDLRRQSAKVLNDMNIDGQGFDGFGIGGSFTKDDMGKTVKTATEVLSENKPRHLLGIGEPIDFFIGIEYGIDTFDCVTPTRIARHGNIYTDDGKINMLNSKYKTDMSLVSDDPNSPAHKYTKSYLSHLYRSQEILASQIASAHNLYFLINLVNNIRESILQDKFFEYKKDFCDKFYKGKVL